MTALRCRRGWHSWRFVSMADARMVTVPPYSTWICELVEQCRLCDLRRTSSSAQIPKRVRA